MPSLLPIFLNLQDKPVLVIGGGPSAHEKLSKLLPTGAQITVVARRIHVETRQLLLNASIQHHERTWQASDVLASSLVISAVDDAIEHARIAAAARAAKVLINAVDAPASTDCYFGAQVERGPLLIAISTHGKFPGLARAMRLWLDELLPTSLGQDVEDLSNLRRSAQQRWTDPTSRMAALKGQLATWLQSNRPPSHPQPEEHQT